MLAVIGRRNLLDRFSSMPGPGRAVFGRGAGLGAAAPRIAEVFLVAILGVILALIFISLFSPLPLPHGDPAVTGQALRPNDVQLIVKSPFPSTEIEAAQLNDAPAVAETTLDLTLTGVWANPDGGSATIRTPGGKEQRFAVGDTIVNGVTLTAVFADQVTINRNGVREALRFESKTQLRPPAQERRGAAAPTDITSASVGRLAGVLRLAPAMDSDGKLAIEIYAARDHRTFAALGLQNGDRLVSINGTPAPTNAAALSDALSGLQRSDAARIVVERNGAKVPITISMDQLGVRNAE